MSFFQMKEKEASASSLRYNTPAVSLNQFIKLISPKSKPKRNARVRFNVPKRIRMTRKQFV